MSKILNVMGKMLINILLISIVIGGFKMANEFQSIDTKQYICNDFYDCIKNGKEKCEKCKEKEEQFLREEQERYEMNKELYGEYEVEEEVVEKEVKEVDVKKCTREKCVEDCYGKNGCSMKMGNVCGYNCKCKK